MAVTITIRIVFLRGEVPTYHRKLSNILITSLRYANPLSDKHQVNNILTLIAVQVWHSLNLVRSKLLTDSVVQDQKLVEQKVVVAV